MREYRSKRFTLRVNWLWSQTLLWGLTFHPVPWAYVTLHLGPLALVVLRTNTWRW